jgi:C_GCAxxG_C_C family probable redox protein
LAVAERYDIQSTLIPGIATGFCGGMSRTSGLCGALVGGIMALGMLYGRTSAEAPHYTAYALTERLVRDFEKQFGSRNCTDLLGCNISTKHGEAVFYKKNLGKTRCRDITAKTAELLNGIMENLDNIKHTLITPQPK